MLSLAHAVVWVEVFATVPQYCIFSAIYSVYVRLAFCLSYVMQHSMLNYAFTSF